MMTGIGRKRPGDRRSIPFPRPWPAHARIGVCAPRTDKTRRAAPPASATSPAISSRVPVLMRLPRGLAAIGARTGIAHSVPVKHLRTGRTVPFREQRPPGRRDDAGAISTTSEEPAEAGQGGPAGVASNTSTTVVRVDGRPDVGRRRIGGRQSQRCAVSTARLRPGSR
jgi:hypothetical protein